MRGVVVSVAEGGGSPSRYTIECRGSSRFPLRVGQEIDIVACGAPEDHEWEEVTTHGDVPNRRRYVCLNCPARMEEPWKP